MKVKLEDEINRIAVNDIILHKGDVIRLHHKILSPSSFIIEAEEDIEKLSQFKFSSVYLFLREKKEKYSLLLKPVSGILIGSKFAVELMYKYRNTHFVIANQLLININKGLANGEIEIINELSSDDLMQVQNDSRLIDELYELWEVEKMGLPFGESSFNTKIRHYIIHIQNKWKVGGVRMFNSPMD